jgi:hypothetical protein
MCRGVGLDKRVISLVLVLIFLIGGVFAATITIDSGATYATSTSVVVTIGDNPVVDNNYCITTVADSNSSCSWTTATSTDDFNIAATLSSGDGVGKTLYLFDQDTTTSSISNTITLDSTAPAYDSGDVENAGEYETGITSITLTYTDATAGINTLSATFDGNTETGTGSVTFSDLNLQNGSYSISVDVNDNAGNTTTETISFLVDTTLPSLTSLSNNYSGSGVYTTDETPAFTIGLTEVNPSKLYFSCNSDSDWDEITYASSISSFDMTTGNDCNTAEGAKQVWVKVEDIFGNFDGPVSTTVNYDNTAPNSPINLSASTSANQVVLTWAAPNESDMSGIASYKVFKNGDEIDQVTTPTKTITGLSNGVSYTFKVQAIDGAGNISSYSTSIDAVPNETDFDSSVSVQRDGSSVTYVQDGDNLTISCSLEFESDNVRIKYRYNNGTTQNLGNETDNTKSISDDLTVDGSYNEIDFWCNWTYSGSNSDSSLTTVYIDSQAPVITWPSDFNTVFAGNRTVEVEVTDNKSVGTVDFMFNNISRGTNKSGNDYSFTLDSTETANGTYTLKAIAKDSAGNETESSKTITIRNIVSEATAAEQAISEAKTAKANVEDLMNYFINEGLAFSLELTAKKDNADILLAGAEAETDLALKQSKAESAKAEYDEISTSASVETIESKTITFTDEGVTEQLLALGLSVEKVEELKNKLINGNVERKISVVKIGSEYRAQVQISLTVDTEEATYKIVEVIPKELALNASEIFSELEFNIIENDPVIEFIVPAGVTSITYSIGNLDEDKKRLIADGNIATKFAMPPILLGETDDSRTIIAPAIDIIFLVAAGIIIVIIAIVIIVGVVLVSKGKKDGDGPAFGHTEKKSSFGGFSGIKRNNKPKAGDGKWKYNG